MVLTWAKLAQVVKRQTRISHQLRHRNPECYLNQKLVKRMIHLSEWVSFHKNKDGQYFKDLYLRIRSMQLITYLTKIIVEYISAHERHKNLNTCIVKPRIRDVSLVIGKALTKLSEPGMIHRGGEWMPSPQRVSSLVLVFPFTTKQHKIVGN